jgi:hypothetical protein
MNQLNTVALAIFIALGVMLVAGLIAIPAVDQAAQALKGHQGDKDLALKGHQGDKDY